MSTNPIPALRSLMRRQALKTLALSVLLVFGSLPFFVFAYWFGVVAFVAFALLGWGGVLFVSGCYRLLFPFAHPALAPLGSRNEQREQAIREIEMELEWPDVWRARTGRGSEIIISPRWVVHYDDSDFGIVRRDDVVWIYEYQKTSFSGSHPAVLMATRFPVAASAIEIGPLDSWVLPTLTQAMPFAFVGLHLQLGHVPRSVLGYHVDARRHAAASAAGATSSSG